MPLINIPPVALSINLIPNPDLNLIEKVDNNNGELKELTSLFVEKALLDILLQYYGIQYIITPQETLPLNKKIFFPSFGGCNVIINKQIFYVPSGFMFNIDNIPENKVNKIIIISSLKFPSQEYIDTIYNENFKQLDWGISFSVNKRINIGVLSVYYKN